MCVRRRRVYEDRHRVLLRAVGDLLPELELVPSAAGLHVALLEPDGHGFDGRRIAERAAVAGVAVQPVSRFRRGPGPDGVLLGFGGIPAADIPDGLRTLAEAIGREQVGHPAHPVP